MEESQKKLFAMIDIITQKAEGKSFKRNSVQITEKVKDNLRSLGYIK